MDYLTNDTDLKKVADAIRAKGGTSAPLDYPSGFVSAIHAIPSGSAKEEQEKTVTITANGTVEITPDAGKTLSKATAVVNVPTSGGGGPMGKDALYAWIKANGIPYADGVGVVDVPAGATTLYAGFKDAYGNVCITMCWRDWELYTFPPIGSGSNGMYWFYSGNDDDLMDFKITPLENIAVADAAEWNNVPNSYNEETGNGFTYAVEGYYIFV